MYSSKILFHGLVATLLIGTLAHHLPQGEANRIIVTDERLPMSYIVQADGTDSAVVAILEVGGKILDESPMIGAAAARLTENQAARLRARSDVHAVLADSAMRSIGALSSSQGQAQIDSGVLPREGMVERGVTLAALDTGA